ncbi:oxidoreductase [Xylariaceae sp. AK1471]|nr:oxidoreductase [Xylariaceae sp. AK1471]
MPRRRILIVGCGVAGPTLVTFLLMAAKKDVEFGRPPPLITVLERSAQPYAHGANVDIRGAGVSILRKMGLESAVRACTTGEEGVRFVDGEDRVLVEFPADKTGKTSTPTSDIEIMRGRLAELLFARSKHIGENIMMAAVQEDTQIQQQKEECGGKAKEVLEYIFGDRIESLEQDDDEVRVRLVKGGDRTFDLVVGADGLHSQTRKSVFGEEGEEERVRRLGMYAGFFSMPKGPRDSLWRRWFHAPGRRGIMQRPAELGTDRSTVLIYVVNEKDQRLKDASGRKSVEAQRSLLKEYFTNAGWECDRIIEEMEAADDFYYDTVAQVKMDTWSKGRVVLLGDAGYCASFISGMGTTLGLNGAHILAGALARHPDDHSAAFAEYEQKMRPIVDKAQKLAPGMPHAINPETAWGIWTMHNILAFMSWSGLRDLMFKFGMGPPAHQIKVEDFGFGELPDWKKWKDVISKAEC